MASAPPSIARCPAIWPSAARILAMVAIFVFHYLGRLRLNQYYLDFYAILTFSFLSGYLLHLPRTARFEWAVHRYLGIMVPYWLVIIPVMIANVLVGHKALSLTSHLVSFFGGNLFLENPLYVIAWYVTFVLLLYAYALVESFFNGWKVVACMLAGAVVFYGLGLHFFFVSFLAGLRLAGTSCSGHKPLVGAWRQKLSRGLFVVQRYCYAFFLIHGGVLLMFERMGVSRFHLFWTTFAGSTALSVALYPLSKALAEAACRRILSLRKPVPAGA